MTNLESEALEKQITDTWSTPNQKRIEGFLAMAALRIDELDTVDL